MLTAQPSLAAGQIGRGQYRLAMAVGTSRKYRIGDLHGRHFVETGRAAGLSVAMVEAAMADLHAGFDAAFVTVEAGLPAGFSEAIHAAVLAGASDRLRQLRPGV